MGDINTDATNTNSIAIAKSAVSSGVSSIAIGFNTDATNTAAIAIGDEAKATSISSIAIGDDANASATHSIVIGSGDAIAAQSISIGRDSDANTTDSIAIGHRAKAIGANTIAMGSGTGVGGVYMTNDTPNSIGFGWDETVPSVLFARDNKSFINSEEGLAIGLASTSGLGNIDAILEIESTDKAVLFPRMTNPSSSILTPVNGMVAYNTTTDKLQVYAGGSWVDLH